MAGHVVATYLKELDYDVTTLSASNKLDENTHLVDVTDKADVERALALKEFDVIVNCIGILISESNADPSKAIYINSFFPKWLEKKYENSKTKIIHLSTDCVFSGDSAPYKEDSFKDGDTFYDRSKALGEIVNDKDLTFRMSIIGPELKENGSGLFGWFWRQSGKTHGYTKAIWNGVTTIELARAINEAIRQNLTGLYHLVPADNISKFNLLQQIKATFKRNDIELIENEDLVVDKTLLNTRNDFKFDVRDYKTQIEDMRTWIESHSGMYSWF